MGYPDGGDVEGLFRTFYSAQPEGVVTDRFGTTTYDVATPNYARRHAIADRPWESVRPLGMSFGWNRQESEAETLTGREIVHLLLDVVSKNGNLLLGVSPDAQGDIPAVQQKSLAELGDWLSRYGDSVYGTRPWTASETTTADGVQVRFTTAGDTLFVHLLSQPDTSCTVLGLSVSDDGNREPCRRLLAGRHDLGHRRPAPRRTEPRPQCDCDCDHSRRGGAARDLAGAQVCCGRPGRAACSAGYYVASLTWDTPATKGAHATDRRSDTGVGTR